MVLSLATYSNRILHICHSAVKLGEMKLRRERKRKVEVPARLSCFEDSCFSFITVCENTGMILAHWDTLYQMHIYVMWHGQYIISCHVTWITHVCHVTWTAHNNIMLYVCRVTAVVHREAWVPWDLSWDLPLPKLNSNAMDTCTCTDSANNTLYYSTISTSSNLTDTYIQASPEIDIERGTCLEIEPTTITTLVWLLYQLSYQTLGSKMVGSCMYMMVNSSRLS